MDNGLIFFFQIIKNAGILGGFVLAGLGVFLLLKRFTSPPQFVQRKILHTIAFMSTVGMLLCSESWLYSTITALCVAVGLYLFISIIERFQWYEKIFVQKSKGEMKLSLTMFFALVAVLTTICGGCLSRPEYVVISILVWGFGDGAAALIGVPFGRHIIPRPISDGKKSAEGTLAMGVASFLSAFLLLWLYGGIFWGKALGLAMVISVVSSFVELVSPGEWDTLTIPVSVMGCLVLFEYLPFL